MSSKSNIPWTDSTASPWFICGEVSSGCALCYAREWLEFRYESIIRRAYELAGFADWRTRPIWGKKATRVLTKGFWTEVPKWNRQAERNGIRRKVFPSMIDWLDDFPAGVIDQDEKHLAPAEVLARFVNLIHTTPMIDWLLLTKRIENFRKRLEEIEIGGDHFGVSLLSWLGFNQPWHNVWLGVSVEDQKRADERIPELLKIPAAVRFLSVEPLLEAVDLRGISARGRPARGSNPSEVPVDWVIVGGESGPDGRRRDCGVEAIVSVAEQCQAAGVPVFVKQDCQFRSDQQGRIPDHIWKLKQFPAGKVPVPIAASPQKA